MAALPTISIAELIVGMNRRRLVHIRRIELRHSRLVSSEDQCSGKRQQEVKPGTPRENNEIAPLAD